MFGHVGWFRSITEDYFQEFSSNLSHWLAMGSFILNPRGPLTLNQVLGGLREKNPTFFVFLSILNIFFLLSAYQTER